MLNLRATVCSCTDPLFSCCLARFSLSRAARTSPRLPPRPRHNSRLKARRSLRLRQRVAREPTNRDRCPTFAHRDAAAHGHAGAGSAARHRQAAAPLWRLCQCPRRLCPGHGRGRDRSAAAAGGNLRPGPRLSGRRRFGEALATLDQLDQAVAAEGADPTSLARRIISCAPRRSWGWGAMPMRWPRTGASWTPTRDSPRQCSRASPRPTSAQRSCQRRRGLPPGRGRRRRQPQQGLSAGAGSPGAPGRRRLCRGHGGLR